MAGEITQATDGRITGRAGLSDMQQAFVRFVANGAAPTKAAGLAEYAHPAVQGSRLMKNPAILAAIRVEQNKRLASLNALAINCVEAILSDPNAPVKTRADLSIKVMNLAGMGTAGKGNQGNSDPMGDLVDMSIDDLERMVADMKRQRSDEAIPTPGVEIAPHEARKDDANPLIIEGKTLSIKDSASSAAREKGG